jgi:hypothetical protein
MALAAVMLDQWPNFGRVNLVKIRGRALLLSLGNRPGNQQQREKQVTTMSIHASTLLVLADLRRRPRPEISMAVNGLETSIA